MSKTGIVFLWLGLLFTTTLGNDAAYQKENNNSAENIGSQNSRQTKCQESDERDCYIDYANSNESDPLDSHEAMNTREFKARNKRSAEVDKKAFRNMLLGLVHKKSADMKEDTEPEDAHSQKFQSEASELLLELMVRIAAHPLQWNEVHSMLQKIDSDIMTSKKILSELQDSVETTTGMDVLTTKQSQIENSTQTNNSVDEVQKLIILLDNESEYQRNKNNATKQWPNLETSADSNGLETEDNVAGYENYAKEKPTTTENIYPWNNKQSLKNTTREFEFAYHRVTGLPLPYRSNYDKTRARNAYIAVSVIAPKSRDVRLEKQDNLLEDELRQLKPWSHEDNLNKMENLRKRWFIQSVKQNENP